MKRVPLLIWATCVVMHLNAGIPRVSQPIEAADAGASLIVQTEHTADRIDRKLTRIRLWWSDAPEEDDTVLVCAGRAQVYDTVTGEAGHAMVLGKFTGTLVWGERVLRAEGKHALFYLVLVNGRPHALYALSSPGADLPLHLTYTRGRFFLETWSVDEAGIPIDRTLVLDRYGVFLNQEISRLTPDSEPPTPWVIDESDEETEEDPEG